MPRIEPEPVTDPWQHAEPVLTPITQLADDDYDSDEDEEYMTSADSMLTVGDIRGCDQCMHHADALGPSFLHACASVGIEHGMSTERTMLQYLAGYHRRGHVDVRP